MSKKPQFGPWLGFVNSGRFKQKGFEKNHPVIILSVSDGGYGPSCRVIGLHEWWTNDNAAGLAPVQYVKASGVSIIPFNNTPKDASSAEHLWRNNLLRADDWPSSEEGLNSLLRMSHNWSSEWQEKIMSNGPITSVKLMRDLLVAQGYMRDQKAADALVWFYGQIVRDTDKAYLVSVGPDKEEHWFAKSQTNRCGHLKDRPEQSILLTKQWQLKSKVGDGLCDVFVKAEKAIHKHGVLDTNPLVDILVEGAAS